MSVYDCTSYFKNRKIIWNLSPLHHRLYRVRVYDIHNVTSFILDFGDINIDIYKDRTPLRYFTSLEHNDDEKRRIYLKCRFLHNVNSKHLHPFTLDWFEYFFLY